MKTKEEKLPEFLRGSGYPSLDEVFQNYEEFKTVSVHRQKLVLAHLLGPMVDDLVKLEHKGEVVNHLLDIQ